MASEDAIVVSRLDGSARRLLGLKVPRVDAVAELQAITRRPDLLTLAAGTALGAWRHNPVGAWQGHDMCELLIEAGGRRERAEEVAAAVAKRLSRVGGVGAPRS